MTVKNLTHGATLADNVRVARTFREKSEGLLKSGRSVRTKYGTIYLP